MNTTDASEEALETRLDAGVGADSKDAFDAGLGRSRARAAAMRVSAAASPSTVPLYSSLSMSVALLPAEMMAPSPGCWR